MLVTMLLFIYCLWSLFTNRKASDLVGWLVRLSNICCASFVTLITWQVLSDPFVVDKFKLRSFYFQSVEGRLFNAYFKPVGAYSGGYGNFWITETSRFCPIFEHQVYWNRTVDHDFGDDTVDGEEIDNYEVVRRYIREEVIAK